MREDSWECELDGINIRCTNWIDFLRLNTGENLFVNGQLVDSRKSGLWSNISAYLAVNIKTNGKNHFIEAIMGPGGGKTWGACHIFCDGELVGGDIDVALQVPSPEVWEKSREQGAVSYIFIKGILLMGLPFAILTALLNQNSDDIYQLIIQHGLSGAFFGAVMGWFLWRGGEKGYKKMKSKMNSSPIKIA